MKNIFKIRFHPFFYLVVVIYVFTGHFHDFFLFLAVILFHELGHIVGGTFYHWKIDEVLILPFGAITIFNEWLNKPLKEEFFVAVLGPIFQIFFYFLFKNIWNITSIHYSLLFFNLLPIIPLDGSKIIKVIFHKFFPFKKGNWFTIVCSIIIIVFVTIFSLFYQFNFLLFLIFFFIVIKIYNEIKDQPLIFQKFLYERYFIFKKYRRLRKIKGKNLSKIYKDCHHLFYIGDKWYTEREILRKRFDFKDKL